MTQTRTTQITGLAGDRREVAQEALDTLAGSLDGSVMYPDDDGFAEATLLWNGMIKKRPAVVVRAESTADVVAAVNFVRENQLELSIKGGGHNIAGLALSDGGITLDMSGMKGVEVDAKSRLARVGPGCTLGDVDRATQEHGLATTLGFVSATGVAGLTVGGGFGYLTRRFGWTVDDLEEVEVVTADGTARRASRTENEDLFWALRGGGGNFGVVTEFVFRLHEIGPEVTAGLIAWPASEADGVLDVYRRVAESAPPELTLVVLRRNAPPAPWVPEAYHGKPVIVVVACHSGSPEQAQEDLAPIKSHGEPLADLIQVKPYVAQQSMLDATQPKGMHYYWKSEFLPGVSDELFATFNQQFVDLEAPANQIVLFQVGGALNEHPEDDGSMGNREAAFACVIQAMWPGDSPAADANRAWVRNAWQALKPYSTGGNYVNFQTEDETDERTEESYRGNFERLGSVKATYDPSNLFRVNRNIRP
ncbi:MAG TPA: FAD-binding oxidoreductase [Candidatus Limnocylindrales bacterium]|nr:FAD-binding oxidoreductase [Candidatus Limnocylindrales bacterium]